MFRVPDQEQNAVVVIEDLFEDFILHGIRVLKFIDECRLEFGAHRRRELFALMRQSRMQVQKQIIEKENVLFFLSLLQFVSSVIEQLSLERNQTLVVDLLKLKMVLNMVLALIKKRMCRREMVFLCALSDRSRAKFFKAGKQHRVGALGSRVQIHGFDPGRDFGLLVLISVQSRIITQNRFDLLSAHRPHVPNAAKGVVEMPLLTRTIGCGCFGNDLQIKQANLVAQQFRQRLGTHLVDSVTDE